MTNERLEQTVFFLLVLAAMLLTLSLQSASWAKAIVQLQPDSVVGGGPIRLGDIASIQGISSSQSSLLGGVVLGQAPAPARHYDLRRSYVIAKMKQHLIDMDAVTVLGPEVVRVRAEGNVLAGGRLVELAQAYVLRETGWDKAEVRFEVCQEPRAQALPPGKADIEVWKVSGDYYGLTHFRTAIQVEGETVASVPLVMNIHRSVPVWVACGELNPGAVLAADDLRVARRDLSREPQRVRRNYCRPDVSLLGKRVKTFVQNGRVLVYDMLNDPPVVERGKRVMIEARRGEILVTAQGVARASAAVGETVPVHSLLSNKTIMARVTGPGTVVVE